MAILIIPFSVIDEGSVKPQVEQRLVIIVHDELDITLDLESCIEKDVRNYIIQTLIQKASFHERPFSLSTI